ncbi:MAG: hypothetical protein ABW156_11920 [Jiangellaceae bacterium]
MAVLLSWLKILRAHVSYRTIHDAWEMSNGGLGGHRGPGRHSDRTPVSQHRLDGGFGLML